MPLMNIENVAAGMSYHKYHYSILLSHRIPLLYTILLCIETVMYKILQKYNYFNFPLTYLLVIKPAQR